MCINILSCMAFSFEAYVFFIQRDTTGLSSENTELKLRLQAMEQQAHLRDGKVPKIVLLFLCTIYHAQISILTFEDLNSQ